MANGATLAHDLVKHASYQAELTGLLKSLTKVDDAGHTVAALAEKAAIDAAIKFRRAHGLLVDPHADPLIYLIGLHQARIRHAAMTLDEINWSEHWLLRNGHRCNVDTLFNPKPKAAKP